MAVQVIPALPLPPPDDETAALLEQMANTPALTPADPRYVTFRTVPKKDKEASLAEGRPISRPVEYIQILTPGDKDTIIDRPVRKLDRYVYQDKYLAFRASASQESGTPLSAWGGISEERVEELKHFKISTVEALADLADAHLSGKGMTIRKERDKARNYLAAMKDDAPIAEMKAENAALKERMAALEALAAKMGLGADAAAEPNESAPVSKPKGVRKEAR